MELHPVNTFNKYEARGKLTIKRLNECKCGLVLAYRKVSNSWTSTASNKDATYVKMACCSSCS